MRNSIKALLAAFACTGIAAASVSAATINPSADSRSRDKTPDDDSAPTAATTSDLAVGPVSGSNDFFRAYLAFDLSAESAATVVSLTLNDNGANEANTTALSQTFTLFVVASDWDGVLNPGGTDVATTVLNVAAGNDTQGLSFSSTALKDAFNSAVGGTLYLGVRSDAETSLAGTRSFKWFGSVEDSGAEPELTYTPVPEPGSLILLAAGGLCVLRRRRG